MWSVSRLATVVGLLGLLPFLAGAVAVWFWNQSLPWISGFFYLYTAGILAFMAGIYWPLSMQLSDQSYPISPMGALLLSQGFFLLAGLGLLIPPAYRIGLFPLAYGLLYLADRQLLKGYWPGWYLSLRLGLTLVAILAQISVGLALLLR